MAIQTKFELTGDWSNTADGDAFIQQVANETSAELDVIGKSFENRDIYRLTVGAGDKLLFITGGVHRSEPASREAVMMKMRDVAYDVDGKYADFLTTHRIMFVPTVQPDREITRHNAQDININRDAYLLKTPEMRVLMKTITETSPEVYVDFHERSGSLDQVEFIDTMGIDPNAQADIKEGNAAMTAFIRSQLESDGYTTVPYPQNIIGPGMTISTAGMLGIVSMTPETHMTSSSRNFRANALKQVFEEVLIWHASNADLIAQIKEAYTIPIKPSDTFVLFNGNNEYYNNATKLQITTPKGYQLSNPSDFTIWQESYGIEVDANGFVPTSQRAGRLIPHLLDPLSENKAASATRIEVDSGRRTDGRYTKVLYDEWREVFVKSYALTESELEHTVRNN